MLKKIVSCGAAVLLLGTAACSSSTSKSSGPASKAGTSTGTGGSSKIAAALETTLKEHNSNPTSLPIPSEPLKSKPKPGTTIDVLTGPTAEAASWRAGVQAAAGMLGMKYKYVNIGNTPDTVVSAWNSVLQQKPDVLIMNAFPPAIYQQQLDKYTAGGGIAIAFALGQPGVPKGFKFNYYRNDSVSNQTPMQLMAAEIAQDSAGKAARVLFVSSPAATILTVQGKYFKDALKQCSNCTLDGEVDVDFASIGSKLPGQVVSYLQGHPKVKYLALAFGAMAQGVPEALKAAGLNDVKIVTHSGSAFNFDLVRHGGQLMDTADDFHFVGARLVDAAARILAGQDPGQDTSVIRIVTKSTIGNMKLYPDGTWQAVPDYLSAFKAAWKV